MVTRQFDLDLHEIDQHVIYLFALVAEVVLAATDSLLADDRSMAKLVVDRDEQIDDIYIAVEELV